MAWINGRFKESEQNNSLGMLSIDWEEAGEVIYTHTEHIDTKSAGLKNGFKANAIKAKNEFLAKLSKESTISTNFTIFMNS